MTPSSEPRPLPKRWQVHHQIPNDIYRELGDFSPLMRQLLYNRVFESSESAAAFINGTVDFPTDPFLIKDMDAAVGNALHKAVTEGEKLPFTVTMDADGVTSTSLLVEFLAALGRGSPTLYPRPVR